MECIKKEGAIWETKQNLYCDNCNKKHNSLYEINEKGKYCFNCFKKEFEYINEEFSFIRMIKQEHGIKEKRKIERNKMSPKKRYEILKRDSFKCVLCGSCEKLQIDHIIPISKGGKSIKSNLQTLCFLCNIGKGVSI